MSRISIVGDIMCEPLLLEAAERRGSYDFSPVFDLCEDLFSDTDYLIGNLETPLAGKESGYTRSLFSFNAPDELAAALKGVGFDLILTANNHCLDRGIEGMKRTLRVLEASGLSHVGTSVGPDCLGQPFFVDLPDTRIAVLSYTYGTNYRSNGHLLQGDDLSCVNLLQPQESHRPPEDKERRGIGKALAQKLLTHEQRIWVKKKLGMTYYSAYRDDVYNAEEAEPFLLSMESSVKRARESADFVIFCPHVGGQFNKIPGLFTEYVIKRAVDAGVHAVVASHPHVVQTAARAGAAPCFYSLGNFAMSPNSVYLLHENLPDYGIVVHLDVVGDQLEGCSFSIVKSVERKGEILRVTPVSRLFDSLESEEEKHKLESEVRAVYRTVVGRKMEEESPIRAEYILNFSESGEGQ